MRKLGAWRAFLTASGLAAALFVAVLAAPAPASANPTLNVFVGSPGCSSCHSGQEQQTQANGPPAGLNANGVAFWRCGEAQTCWPPPPPTPPPVPTSAMRAGQATIPNDCPNGGFELARVWQGGRANSELQFQIEPGKAETLQVEQGTTWAGACGTWPPDSVTSDPLQLDP